MVATSADQEIPSEFLCPLTLQPFEYPLMSKYGTNYERSAIVEWLDRGNDSCPLTRQPLKLSGLIHNKVLQDKVHQWMEENGYERGEPNKTESTASRLTRAGLVANAKIQIKSKKKGTTPTSAAASTSNRPNQREPTTSESSTTRRIRLWGGRKRRGGDTAWC